MNGTDRGGKLIPFPRQRAHDIEGVELYRTPEGWALRRVRAGRVVEMRQLSEGELRSLHQQLELTLDVYF